MNLRASPKLCWMACQLQRWSSGTFSTILCQPPVAVPPRHHTPLAKGAVTRAQCSGRRKESDEPTFAQGRVARNLSSSSFSLASKSQATMVRVKLSIRDASSFASTDVSSPEATAATMAAIPLAASFRLRTGGSTKAMVLSFRTGAIPSKHSLSAKVESVGRPGLRSIFASVWLSFGSGNADLAF